MTVPDPVLPGVPPHSSDERTMAALAHASAVLNFITGIGGPIAALVIWATQREKSPWVAFHALQSLVFQLGLTALTVAAVMVIWVVGFAISFATLGVGTIIAVPVMILSMFGAFAAIGGGMIYSLYGAYQIHQGREFRYLWIGDWLAGQYPVQVRP